MIDTNEDGAESMYLETSEEHRRTDGLKQSYLPNFKANTERFYDAQCFNLALIEHPELKEEVVMAVAEKPHK